MGAFIKGVVVAEGETPGTPPDAFCLGTGPQHSAEEAEACSELAWLAPEWSFPF